MKERKEAPARILSNCRQTFSCNSQKGRLPMLWACVVYGTIIACQKKQGRGRNYKSVLTQTNIGVFPSRLVCTPCESCQNPRDSARRTLYGRKVDCNLLTLSSSMFKRILYDDEELGNEESFQKIAFCPLILRVVKKKQIVLGKCIINMKLLWLPNQSSRPAPTHVPQLIYI